MRIILKKIIKNLHIPKKYITFAPLLKPEAVIFDVRRDGRVVDYNGLENRRAERHRGFESLSLRKECEQEERTSNRMFFFLCKDITCLYDYVCA